MIKERKSNQTFFLRKNRINKASAIKAKRPKVTPTPIPTDSLFSLLESIVVGTKVGSVVGG